MVLLGVDKQDVIECVAKCITKAKKFDVALVVDVTYVPHIVGYCLDGELISRLVYNATLDSEVDLLDPHWKLIAPCIVHVAYNDNNKYYAHFSEAMAVLLNK